MRRPLAGHLRYLWYVMVHKWFVLVEGRKLGLGLWQLAIHDLSKFGPSEWGPYVTFFYDASGRPVQRRDGTGYYHVADEKAAFSAAWNHHVRVNPHHWQAWLLVKDGGAVVPLRMPRKFVLEMVADWRGAGRAQGTPDTVKWYAANGGKMVLHEETRREVEALLGVVRNDAVSV